MINSLPHPIRLRGPWECEPLERYGGGPLPAAARADVPGDWGALLGAGFRGRVRYRRWFHRPAEIAPHERAWLVVEGLDPRGTVALNGRLLGAVAGYALPAAFEITPLLLPRNELLLEIDFPAEQPGMTADIVRPGREGLPGGPLGEARLEIRGLYYVDDFALTALERGDEVEVAASGIVRGRSAADAVEPADHAPLDLIVATERGELLSGEVLPGRSFALRGTVRPFAPWRAGQPCRLAEVEAKLLDGGARVWQRRLRTAHRLADDPASATSAEVIEQVLDEAAYTRFDEQGRAVVQRLPAEWAGIVCPRLAHHPAIVGWMCESTPPPAAESHGRPWIAASLVSGPRVS